MRTCIASLNELKRALTGHLPFLLFLVIISFAYFQLHSISLENWDAGSFAIFVRDGYTSTRLYVPHALYLIMGRQLHLATGIDAIVILTSISSFAAIVALICSYATTILLLRDRNLALLATIILAFSNQFWLSAEEALSDMFALSLTSIAVLIAALAWRRQSLWLGFLSYLTFGVSIGARLTQVWFLGIPLVLRVGVRLRRNLILLAVGVAVGIIAWLLPVLMYYAEVFDSLRSLLPTSGRPLGVLAIGSVFIERFSLQNLFERVVSRGIVNNFLLQNFGAWFHPEIPMFRSMASLTLIALALALACVRYLRGVSRIKLLFLAWILPYFIFSVTAWEPLRPPSAIIQVLPPVCILLAFSLAELAKFTAARAPIGMIPARNAPRILVPVLFLALIFAFTFSNVLILHSQRQGVDAIADYLESRYAPSQVLVVYAWEWTRMAYYIPQYVDYNLFVIDPANQAEILWALSQFATRSVLITGQAIELVKTIAHRQGYMLVYQEIFRHSRSDLVHALDGTDVLYRVNYFAEQ